MINGAMGCAGAKAAEVYACPDVRFWISVVWSKCGSRYVRKKIQSANHTRAGKHEVCVCVCVCVCVAGELDFTSNLSCSIDMS
jgi:hypothetical protein